MTRPVRIVLVDDDALQLKLNKHILESEGFEVYAATDAAVALDDARAHKPDLIVSDVLMGEVDGFGLCRRVKADEALASVPVLLLSAHYGGEVNLELATRVGARGLVERSIGFERELAAVRHVLAWKGPALQEQGSSMYEEHLRSNANQLKVLASRVSIEEKRRQVMFDAANVGISFVSQEGISVEVNPYWEVLTGYPPCELIGKHISMLAPDRNDPEFTARYRHSLELQSDRVIQPVLHRDGHVVWLEISGQTVELDGTPHMLAFAQDVTARIEAETRASEAEANKRKLEERLAHAQKMDALGRLTGGIAHDFNNLLAVILTHAFFLTEELAPTDPRLQDVQEIAAAGERAAALTKQLLAFSRHQQLKLSGVDVNAVVNNLARMLQRLIGEEQLLEIKTSELGAVRADASQLEQVIVNLVVNARDAMPSGGKVSIETSRMVVGEGQDVVAGMWAVLVVRDSGCGMGEATKRRLFEPFFTTKEKGKGTGLGLSTSYGIVKQFGGHILVNSELGQGTVMRVLLPIVDGEILEAPARSSGDGERRGCETVLLVEDDRAVRGALTRVLEERGYDVLAAGSLEEAVGLMRSHERTVELIVCDVVMPGASGPEAVEKLVGEAPSARVLLMSGYTDHALLGSDVVEGQGFLQKPFLPDVFSRKVREVLGRERKAA